MNENFELLIQFVYVIFKYALFRFRYQIIIISIITLVSGSNFPGTIDAIPCSSGVHCLDIIARNIGNIDVENIPTTTSIKQITF